MAKGSALKGALAAAPRGGRVTSLPVKAPPQGVLAGVAQGLGGGLQRVSPGIYRNAQGQLVNSKGGSLPDQRPQQQRPQMPNRSTDVSGAINSISRAIDGNQPQGQQQPSYRPPMPYPQQDGYLPYPQQNNSKPMWMGGSPNFNEMDQLQTSAVMPDRGNFNGFYDSMNSMPRTDMQNQMLTNRYTQYAQQQGGALRGPQMSPEQQAQMMAEKQAFVQQQGFQQGIVANREPIAPQGQLSPAELQARQNGTFKGYNY